MMCPANKPGVKITCTNKSPGHGYKLCPEYKWRNMSCFDRSVVR